MPRRRARYRPSSRKEKPDEQQIVDGSGLRRCWGPSAAVPARLPAMLVTALVVAFGAVAGLALLPAGSATPPGGALAPPPDDAPGAPPELRYLGSPVAAPLPVTPPDEAMCAGPTPPPGSCDVFTLNLLVPPGYWEERNGRLEVTIDWSGRPSAESQDIDLLVVRSDGRILERAASPAGATRETAVLHEPEGGFYRLVAAARAGGVPTYDGVVRLVVERRPLAATVTTPLPRPSTAPTAPPVTPPLQVDPPVTAPPVSPPPEVAAPAPTVGPADARQVSPRAPGIGGAVPPYDPAAHAADIVAVQVSAFALLALLGASAAGGRRQGGAAGGGAGGPGGTGASGAPHTYPGTGIHGGRVASADAGAARAGVAMGGAGAYGGAALSGAAVVGGAGAYGADSREAGEVASTDVESADQGLLGAVEPRAVSLGDRSRTWRWLGTPLLDRASKRAPARLAPLSPLLARVLNDAGYLRAMFGSASAVVPVLAIVLAVMAVRAVEGEALPPPFGLTVGLAVVGVLDALAGLVGVFVFVAGVVALGGLASADAVRTLLGLATLWFAAPLIAGTARPLRRPPATTLREHWDRTADIVIASLIGAWAVQQILQGLPGLSGLDLPIADQANRAALVVLGALVLRMALETVAAHWYPVRLSQVQPTMLADPPRSQRVAAYLLILGVFLFAAVAYLGSCWQLYVGGALFILPKFLQLLEDRLPNSPRVFAVMPRGIVQVVLLLFVGALLGAVVLDSSASGREAIRDSFVLLSLPGFALAVLELFGREGPERHLRWYHELLGIPILALGVLLALGLITF